MIFIWILGIGSLALGLSQGWPGGIFAMIAGAFILWFAWDLRSGREAKIDSSVRNKIVAQDGEGRYLVEADTSRQITGPRHHVVDNLPASLTQVKPGLWVVDSSGSYSDNYDHINWKPISGDFSIDPRGSQSRDSLADQVEGYEHIYIKENK